MSIDKQNALIWKHTHRDFKGVQDGRKSIMILRNGGSTIVPLDCLTDEERVKLLADAEKRELKTAAPTMNEVKNIMPAVLAALDDLKSTLVHPEPHSVTYGKKYAKVITNGSVYAFIDEHGNIYKPAGWKAPAKQIRGNIFNDDNYSIGKAFGRYGVAYLR